MCAYAHKPTHTHAAYAHPPSSFTTNNNSSTPQVMWALAGGGGANRHKGETTGDRKAPHPNATCAPSAGASIHPGKAIVPTQGPPATHLAPPQVYSARVAPAAYS